VSETTGDQMVLAYVNKRSIYILLLVRLET